MYNKIVDFVKTLYPQQDFIPLHAPVFQGNEKKYLNDCVDSSFVSSVGEYVNRFEEMICKYTGARFAIATTNGTSALHMAFILVGVERETEVLTQALTFVATTNAISYIGAAPVFIDSAENNLGMCPESLEQFLIENTKEISGVTTNKKTGKRISACVPMHVFGNPVDIDKIKKLCDKYKIPLVEDAAESLGSFYKNKHTGLTGDVGILSFNGNKIVTCGGGGMILTNDEKLAKRAKYLTTTAKTAHRWEFYHEEVGYNYRLPNLNAAMACAQMEMLPFFVENKRKTALEYKNFLKTVNVGFIDESINTKSNFWLSAIQFKSLKERNEFLEYSNSNGVMARPVWQLMAELPPFSKCQSMPLINAKRYTDTVVNVPSSVRVKC